MRPGHQVRDAVLSDARALAEIRITSWRRTYAGIVPSSILAAMDMDRNERFFQARIATNLAAANGRETIVVERGIDPGGSVSRVLGYALIGPCSDPDATDLGEVEAIYLDPGAIGRGLGRLLLDEAVDRLRAAGSRAIVLWVLTDNHPARRFYARAGFEPDGAARMLDFDGSAIEEIRYRQTLAPA